MANPSRGTYDSRSINDFEADGMDDDSEKSRLPLLVLIALVVLAAFGGVVWLAYTQGVERGRADAPRIIVAQSRSSAPKVAQSPYAGLNIYQPSTPAGTSSGNPESMSPPPAPLPTTHPAGTPPAAAHPVNAPPALRPTAEAKQEPPPLTPTVRRVRPDSSPTQQQVVEKAAAPAPGKAQPVHAPAPVAEASEADNSSPATNIGKTLLQIGSYKSDSEALRSWNTFKAKHALAAAYQPDIQKVDLGAKGIWYRLRLGAFADKKSAVALCERLRAQGASCLVAR